ncbi:hypothetical protein GOQ27_14150 [Clostridium sp. D2Q-11]|uniref:Nucleotidyltransferase domain-containing protein n=1 Tax=Anaeromonas frigoriresistens TaxID=2683708 RepID=A0A942V484_9FIRM|nr:hypothetical protein [Anaeromonas frigoriresistens]MBS4539612.1 hypothetical protein [Anaeromonas frigoriresistens]
MLDTNTFRDIESFIEHLKKNDEVIGIVEYGGRTYKDMKQGGDYDLTVIFDKTISENINGLHFHLAGIPIDCMLLSIDELFKDSPSNEFMLAHLNSKILYDRDNRVKAALDHIEAKWKVPKDLSNFEISMYRFTFQHVIDKLKHRLHDNELYSRYFIYSSFDWFLECYARIKNLEVGKPKTQLNYIKNNDSVLYEYIRKMYETNNLDVQFEMLKECATHMTSIIGGLWREDEVIFHLAPEGKLHEDEQRDILEKLFI